MGREQNGKEFARKHAPAFGEAWKAQQTRGDGVVSPAGLG